MSNWWHGVLFGVCVTLVVLCAAYEWERRNRRR